jgi:uncharacterized protein (DUF2141 family)
MTMEQQSRGFPATPARVQSVVTLRIAAFLALLLLAASAAPQRDPRGHYAAPAPGQPLCTLNVHVSGFRNNQGTAGGVVFASATGWPEDHSKSIVHGGFPIAGLQALERFQVPPGRYAVVVIHDENSNMKLDRNFFGIPKEGFGFSNNPRVIIAAPSFAAATVPVTCPATQLEIKLIYK